MSRLDILMFPNLYRFLASDHCSTPLVVDTAQSSGCGQLTQGRQSYNENRARKIFGPLV